MTAGAFQTLTLEYRVFGLLDGVTPAPPFSEGVIDGRQIYVFEVQDLGVLPLRFDEDPVLPPNPSAPSTRFITATLLVAEPLGGTNLAMSLVDQTGDLPLFPLTFEGEIPIGSEGVYIRRCIKIPQGCVLLVGGAQAPPGGPAILRLRVQVPSNSEQQALLESACCCKADQPNIILPDNPNEECPPNLSVASVSPDDVILGNPPFTLTITGAGFLGLSGAQVSVVGFVDNLPVSDVVVVNDNTITCTVDPNSLGLFDVYVGDSEFCFASLLLAIRVGTN